MIALDEVPEHLIVVGGSYVGLEFAQMHRRFGAEVTIVEQGDRLVYREDAEISAAIRVGGDEAIHGIVDPDEHRSICRRVAVGGADPSHRV